jgi:Fic family protein
MNKLPYNIDLNNVEILKILNSANYYLGQLQGLLKVLPNPNIVFSLVLLGESKDSSAIENIITTYDSIFKAIATNDFKDEKPKEVIHYKQAIDLGYQMIKDKGFISTNMLIDIQSLIEPNKPGIRKLPGTLIINDKTNEIIHRPPQEEDEIRNLLANLEKYINENDDFDPLIQMVLIHHQFESIHPFYDGNGRTGRILNILYLVLKDKIDFPILYLSKYINESKSEYYRLLKKCNEDIKYISDMVAYFLNGVSLTAQNTIHLILKINHVIAKTKETMQTKLPSIYRYEIIEHLFSQMYTKNESFRRALTLSRATATKYLKLLEKNGFIISEKVGKEVIYKNTQLFDILSD